MKFRSSFGALAVLAVAVSPRHFGVVRAEDSLGETCAAGYDGDECRAAGSGNADENVGGGGNTSEGAAPPRGPQQCGVWLAESTIAGAGLGVYTGKDLEKGDVLDYPEVAIPLMDMSFHNGWEDENYLIYWDYIMNYVHEPGSAGVYNEGEDVEVFVPGIGAIPACHYALNNNVEAKADYDALGFHRGRDPGAGAFSGYHNRWAYMIRSVPAGAELFSDYSQNWFEGRVNEIGLIPFRDSFADAGRFMSKYESFLSKLKEVASEDFKRDFWDIIRHLKFESRTRNALPKTSADADHAMEVGIKDHELRKSMRSPEWFEKNGKCMDNIKPGNSTIPQAGRGAFATRFIPNGAIVAPAPLLHIPNRKMLNMYAGMEDVDGEEMVRDTTKPIGHQLLLNYCFGHRKSSVLLCPYGSTTGYINHNSISPNAKIIWAEDSPNHDAECVKKSVRQLELHLHSCAAFDYVATRDINPGEEVFIDYGAEWEEAWNSHVRDWTPPEGMERFARASELENDKKHLIKTKEEQLLEPYSDNLLIECKHRFQRSESGEEREWTEKSDKRGRFKPCKILTRELFNDEVVYSAEILLNDDDDDDSASNGGNNPIITHIPRKGIRFTETQYSHDEFLINAFRHEMMVPDGMFPEAWKNLA